MDAGQLTLGEAASLLRPGMTVFIHGTATEPRAFVDYLAANPEHLTGVHLLTSFIPGINSVSLAGLAEGSKLTTFMAQPGLSDAIERGDAEALRLQYSKVPGYLHDVERIDLAFIHGRPLPDGDVSTSVSGELIPTACAKAERVCVFENPSLPLPSEGCVIAADRIDYRACSAGGLIEYLGADRADEVSVSIARHVASLVNDGDALQTGIGVIPGAVFIELRTRRGLRINSGMVGDSVMNLADAGALATDTEHLYGMALGSQALYDWLDSRPDFRVGDVTEVHSVERIATVENLVAINSGIEVALDGSVNAEQIGSKVVSGPGGLPDFATGSSRAPGGRSIIALPAANARKGVSRIVARLANHDQPTVAAGIATHIVTEFGIAAIADASPRECAERLIAIADPAHREALLNALTLTR